MHDAALEYDKSQAPIIQSLGAIPVPVDITNVHKKFIAGQVDVVNLPTLAYNPLELQKGMGTKGGVARFPLPCAAGECGVQDEAGRGVVNRQSDQGCAMARVHFALSAAALGCSSGNMTSK